MQALDVEGIWWSRKTDTYREERGAGLRRVAVFLSFGWGRKTYAICLDFGYGIYISTLRC